jgi:hypothetical protein
VKTPSFLLSVMTASVLLLGASLAQEGGHPSQQVVSRSGEKSADVQKDELRNDKDPTRAKRGGEAEAQLGVVARSTTKPRLSATHSKPIPTYRARPRKPTANNPRIDEPGSIASPGQMGTKTASNIQRKAVNPRSPSVPSSAVSINGLQFRNSRNPGSHLAAGGGPAPIARGAAAINGTDVKRRP